MTSFVTSAIAIVCSIPVLVMAYKNLSPRLLVPWLVVNIVPSLAVIGFFIYLAVFELITEGLDDIIGNIVIFAGVLSGGNRMIDFCFEVDFSKMVMFISVLCSDLVLLLAGHLQLLSESKDKR